MTNTVFDVVRKMHGVLVGRTVGCKQRMERT